MKRMYQMIVMILLIGGLAGLSACSDDATPSTNNEVNDADAGSDGSGDVEEDATPPDDGGTDGEDEPDACVPTITECSAEMCGQVDDGCGETLDCGGCPCEAGVVQEESCGTCGLGERTCAADETGFGSCTSPQIPGVAEDADAATCEAKLIFVDASVGSGGDGTQATPFGRYADALTSANAGTVIILGGQTALQEMLTVKSGVSVLGGFSGAPDFRFDAEGSARIEVPGDSGSDVFGIKAEGVDQATTLAQIEVTTGDASQAATNYGAFLRDSSDLTMRKVIVQAGAGGDGIDGDDGAAGVDGQNGADGTEATSAGNMYGASGADGGTNTACPAADGGDGGKGGGQDVYGTGGNSPANDGEVTAGAAGGEAGYDGGGFNDSNARRGKDGESAQSPSSAGADGSGGTSGGQVADGLWEPAESSVDGQRGEHGYGGGGGGGAYFETEPFRVGTGGAGGGAGGCGGQGGEAGSAGGGSFGLFLVRSDPALIDSEFRAGLGGVGGRGGAGGLGGRGGNGGVGTAVTIEYNGQFFTPSTLPYTSGDGGDGSNGREGGAGGGGAGGVSYGAYCSQSRPSMEDGTKVVAGGSARGGQSAGNSGNDGVSEDSFGCE